MNKKSFINQLNPAQIPVIIDGVRTPFLKSSTHFKKFSSQDLGRLAIAGLMSQTVISPSEIDRVIMGSVIHDPAVSNLGREAMLGAGLSHQTPGSTVTLACISGNVAASNICDLIRNEHIKVGIAGGAETTSDLPIQVSKNVRQSLIRLQKAKLARDYINELKKLKFNDLKPQIPGITEFSTGLTMGQSCERLAKRMNVSKEEANTLAKRSHDNAVQAWEKGYYDKQVLPVFIPPVFNVITKDSGPRADTSMEKLQSLRPVFDKKYGTVTAGNSSGLTDGASAALFASLEKALQLGYQPKAAIIDTLIAASDPLEDTLIGPALTITKILRKHNLKASDIDVWEIHEAFASQVVANLKLLNSKAFFKHYFGDENVVGEIPVEKINAWGGSTSLGHPFGATGVRLLSTAADRLQVENGKLAIVSACAAGGHGAATLMEIIKQKE